LDYFREEMEIDDKQKDIAVRRRQPDDKDAEPVETAVLETS